MGRSRQRAEAHDLSLPTQPQTDQHESEPDHLLGSVISIAIFSVSRLVVFAALLYSVRFIPPNRLFDAAGETVPIWHHLLRWDSVWYLAIVRGGYQYFPNQSIQQTVAFFPLYPILCWVITRLTLCEPSTAVLLVSNTASVASVLLIYQYTRKHYGLRLAYGTVALYSFFPPSMFLSAGYTESLAIALTMATFLDLDHSRFFRAAFWSGLLTAVRPTGIVILAPLIYCAWPRERWTRASAVRLMAIVALACSGIVLFALYLGIKFHAPLAFATSENHWYPTHWSLLAGLYSFGALKDVFVSVPVPTSMNAWLFLGCVAVVFAMRSRLSTSELLFTVVTLGFLTLTILCKGLGFGSMGRYLLVIFPIYIAVAGLLEKRPLLQVGLCLWMAVGLFWYSAFFAQWHWVG
jgi:Gpi18-like mannosyltransferase